jgi:hypothetical protein
MTEKTHDTSSEPDFSTPVRNQCDGCIQRAPINGYGNHVDTQGKPFMSCTRRLYQGRDTGLAADFSEFLYRVASQVPFEHATWANERGAALLEHIKRLTGAAQPSPSVELSDEALDELHERLERKVAAAIKAGPATTGGVRVGRRMYLRELLAEARAGLI